MMIYVPTMEESKRLKEDRDLFERWQVVRYRKARRRQKP